MSQQFILCGEIPTGKDGWAGGNTPRGCNPEYDCCTRELAQTRIGMEREELARRLNDILVQSHYAIPLVDRGFVSAHLNALEASGTSGTARCGTSGEWEPVVVGSPTVAMSSSTF